MKEKHRAPGRKSARMACDPAQAAKPSSVARWRAGIRAGFSAARWEHIMETPDA